MRKCESHVTRSRDAILQELAGAEASLREIQGRQAQTRAAIEALRAELATVGSAEPVLTPRTPTAGETVALTPADKVRLFRSLFRGRADIFPVRFVSKRTSKPGYAPACSNKWQPQICLLKSGGKCTDCANQAFVPVTDQVVIDHLQGRHVVGVYPLLEDETCWFLAVDFDGGSWRDDTAAFAATCKSVGVPVAIERSRSGNGAHAWFFFSAQIPAEVAWRMGCYLITESMNRRHELSMKSYDRLFPNQDTMPRGGFGNLIALPLQHEPRRHGNTVFIDEQLQPFANFNVETLCEDRLYLGRERIGAAALAFCTVERLAAKRSAPGGSLIAQLTSLVSIALEVEQGKHLVYWPDNDLDVIYRCETSADAMNPSALLE